MAGKSVGMKHAGEVGGAVPVERLAAGQRFHRAVQAAFLSGPVGGQGFRERRWRLVAACDRKSHRGRHAACSA